jgi:hypothetical protein
MEMLFKIIYNIANGALILNFVFVGILIKKRKLDSKYKYLFIYLLSMLTFGSLLEIKRAFGHNNWNFIESFCLIQSFAHFILLFLFQLILDIYSYYFFLYSFNFLFDLSESIYFFTSLLSSLIN